MINVWIVLVSMSLLLSGFSFSIKISAINRTFLLLPRGIIENSVTILGVTDEEKPYFDSAYLETAVRTYFVDNLVLYVAQFSLAYHYFYQDEDASYLLDRYDGVIIGLKAPLILNYQYQNSLTFTIKSHE